MVPGGKPKGSPGKEPGVARGEATHSVRPLSGEEGPGTGDAGDSQLPPPDRTANSELLHSVMDF